MKSSTTLCLALLFSAIAFTNSSQADNQHPNVLILYADDLGYGDLSCYNATSKIPTPHLDKLASQGMTFTDAHSGSSVCTPTRYGLLTGRYAWRTRLQRGVFGGTDDPPLIAAERLTAASRPPQRCARLIAALFRLANESGRKTNSTRWRPAGISTPRNSRSAFTMGAGAPSTSASQPG